MFENLLEHLWGVTVGFGLLVVLGLGALIKGFISFETFTGCTLILCTILLILFVASVNPSGFKGEEE